MQSDALYKSLLDTLSTAVVLLDTDLMIEYINPAAETLFNISATRLEGKPLADFFAQPERTNKALSRMLKSNQPFTQREAKLNLQGEIINVDYTATPLDDNNRLIIELLPTDRLMQINREKALLSAHSTSQNLIRGLAHEIKNPLGGIRGASQLLAQEIGSDNEIHEYTEIISYEVDRLCNLVDQLLGPSRLPSFKETCIHEITEHVAALVEVEVGNRLVVERDYDPSIPHIECDREQLIQALLNIIRNAVQVLIESETKNPTITLRSRIQRNFTIDHTNHRVICQLDVIDNGPGIPEEIADRIFFPMITGRAEGTGLGLPIAQSAINLHHGLIKHFREDNLTWFSIFLPLRQNQGN